jgi:tetratricopeptide (TPR) repeat protein
MSSYKEITEIVKQNLIKQGLEVETQKKLYKDFVADIVAKRDNDTILVLIRLDRDGIISTFTDARQYTSLPEITSIFVVAPSEIIQEDIKRIIEFTRFGLYALKEGTLTLVREAEKLLAPSLSYGINLRSPVLAGQIFEVQLNLEAREKIVQDIEVSCIAGKPLVLLDGDKTSAKIQELKPRGRVDLSFKIKVGEDTEPGNYPFFISKRANRVPLEVNMFEVQVKKEDENTIREAVRNAVAELNFATSANLENVLMQIESAMLNNVIDIKDNITSESVWNDIGAFCLNNGLNRQAEFVYRRMLETIRKKESMSGLRLHKGLALHNLGIALYSQGKYAEAKQSFIEAYEEDKVTFGESKADDMPAKKALNELSVKSK